MQRRTREKDSGQARTPATMSTYWDRTTWPLQSLCFLLPVLILYEVGTLLYRPDGNNLPAIMAESRVLLFFDTFGVRGLYLPGFLVAAVLFFQHLARKDPWSLEPRLYVLMAGESVLLAAPLFVFMLVLFRQPQPAWMLSGAEEAIPDWWSGVLLSIGAGIYEELVFRLVAILLLHMLLVDLLKMPEGKGLAIAVGVAALAFAAYHFSLPELKAMLSLQAGVGDWARMVFYILAGAYFGLIFALRGFGVVAATHAVYDVLYVSWIFR